MPPRTATAASSLFGARQATSMQAWATVGARGRPRKPRAEEPSSASSCVWTLNVSRPRVHGPARPSQPPRRLPRSTGKPAICCIGDVWAATPGRKSISHFAARPSELRLARVRGPLAVHGRAAEPPRQARLPDRRAAERPHLLGDRRVRLPRHRCAWRVRRAASSATTARRSSHGRCPGWQAGTGRVVPAASAACPPSARTQRASCTRSRSTVSSTGSCPSCDVVPQCRPRGAVCRCSLSRDRARRGQ